MFNFTQIYWEMFLIKFKIRDDAEYISLVDIVFFNLWILFS